jgi:hypothetical protein
LIGRFDVSPASGATIGSGGAASGQLGAAVRGFAGGRGPLLWVFVALALVGAWSVVRRSPLFVVVGASALVVPPALSLAAHVRTHETAFLTPRHLIVALPLWAALIGAGAMRVAQAARRGPMSSALATCAVALLAVTAPATAHDPRLNAFWVATGDVRQTDSVGSWLRVRIESGDLLFPYAVPYLRALPEARRGRSLPRGDARTLVAAVGSGRGARRLWITLPLGPGDRLRPGALRSFRRVYPTTVFPRWLVVQVRGPFAGRRGVLAALDRAVDAASAAVIPAGRDSRRYERVTRDAVDEASRRAR